MATRSSISIRNEDGSYTGIYCHWDGYLSYNGHILETAYTDEAKIRQLMELGDLSSLGTEIGEQHEFRNPHKLNSPEYQEWENRHSNWCTAFARDRGEKNTQADNYRTMQDLLGKLGQEYDYLWDGKGWSVRCYATGTRFVSLSEARRIEAERN